MKKLLYILLFVSFGLFGQGDDPCYSVNDYNLLTQEANQPIILNLMSGWNIMGFSCVNSGFANELLLPISEKIQLVKNNFGDIYWPEFNFNGIGELLPNQGYQIKMTEAAIGFELCTNPIPFHQIEGCTDCEAINFNPWATSDNESCEYDICTDPVANNYQEVLPCIYYGCADPLAANYDPYANTDDGSCIVAQACPYDNYIEYSPSAVSYNAGLCLTLIVEGCTSNNALNYNSNATLDDGTCEFIFDCNDPEADNYNEQATTNDGSCIYFGCTDEGAYNYDPSSNTDDGSCLAGGCLNLTAENYDSSAEIHDCSCIIYGCLLHPFPNFNPVATIDDGSCDMNSSNIYGCTDEFSNNFNPIANIDNGTCSMTIIDDEAYVYIGNTGSNMTVFLSAQLLSQLPNTEENALMFALSESNILVGSQSITPSNLLGGQQTIPVWGDDAQTSEVDGALAGEEIRLYLLNGNTIFSIALSSPITYTSNNTVPVGYGTILFEGYHVDSCIELFYE